MINFNKLELSRYKNTNKMEAYRIVYEGDLAGKIINKYENTDGISGWFLGIELNQKSRNKGIAKAAVLKYLLTHIGLNIYANVRKSNKASIKILSDLGFEIFSETKSNQLIYRYEAKKYNLKPISEIAWSKFYKSVLVDLFVFLANPSKKAIRVPYLKETLDFSKYLIDFCETNKFYYYIDTQYIIISKLNNVNEIHEVDISPKEHIKELGSLLGYPNCCITYVSKYKEEDIDSVEKNLIEKRTYEGIYLAIDFSGYFDGLSLVSHIPCNPKCNNSLVVGLLTVLYIKSINIENNLISNPLNNYIDNKGILDVILLH